MNDLASLLALLTTNPTTTGLLGAVAVLFLRRFNLIPDVSPGPAAEAVDAEITAFSAYLLKVQAGTVKLDGQDTPALKAAKVALDAVLAGK